MLIIKGLCFPQTKAALVHFDEVIKNIAFPNIVHIYNKIGKERNEKEDFISQLVTYYSCRAGALNIFFLQHPFPEGYIKLSWDADACTPKMGWLYDKFYFYFNVFIALDFILLKKILAGFGITVTFSIATNNRQLFSSSVEGLQALRLLLLYHSFLCCLRKNTAAFKKNKNTSRKE